MEAKAFSAPLQPSIRAFFQPRQPSSTTPEKTSEVLPSSLATSSCLPKCAAITEISQSEIPQLRRINALLLPVSYPDSFYRQILSPDPPISYCRVIIWSDPNPKVVGGIVCRIEPASYLASAVQASQEVEEGHNLYIQSLALLSPYRGKGLAGEALRLVIEAASTRPDLKIRSLYAHVWTDNTDVLKWYAAHGFQREEPMLHGYYRRLSPDTAWILRRRFPSTNLLPITSVTSQTSMLGIAPDNSKSPLARSFQEKGPEREWNDLPEDFLVGSQSMNSEANVSSRTQKRVEAGEKVKKKRIYPAAAFGR